jgi:hypothetical protein
MKFLMTTALLLAVLLVQPVLACVWDGGTTEIIPGFMELRRGCCDNDGKYLLVLGPLKINLHTPLHLGVFAFVALAGTYGIVLRARALRKRKKETAIGIGTPLA